VFQGPRLQVKLLNAAIFAAHLKRRCLTEQFRWYAQWQVDRSFIRNHRGRQQPFPFQARQFGQRTFQRRLVRGVYTKCAEDCDLGVSTGDVMVTEDIPEIRVDAIQGSGAVEKLLELVGHSKSYVHSSELAVRPPVRAKIAL
jgi:hypothetical protein